MAKTNRTRPLMEILLAFSPFLLLIVVYKAVGVTNPMVVIVMTWVAYVAILILIGVILRRRGDGWSAVGLEFGGGILKTVLKSIGVFVFAIAAFAFGSIIGANIVGIPEPADMSKYNYLSGNLPMLLISLASVYVVSSFGEEVIYRGFLITRLREVFGGRTSGSNDAASADADMEPEGVEGHEEPPLAQDESQDSGEAGEPSAGVDAKLEAFDTGKTPIPGAAGGGRRGPILAALIVSSVIFGLVHFEWGAMGVFQTTFMGGALGVSFIWNKFRLWPLVLAHCYLDTILLVQLYFA